MVMRLLHHTKQVATYCISLSPTNTGLLCPFPILYLDEPTFDVVSDDARCMRIDDQSVTCFVMLDTDVTIDCLVDSFPEGMQEIGELPESLNVSNIQIDETSITIDGVTENNLGTYQCLASNVVDGFERSGSVSISIMEGGKCTAN